MFDKIKNFISFHSPNMWVLKQITNVCIAFSYIFYFQYFWYIWSFWLALNLTDFIRFSKFLGKITKITTFKKGELIELKKINGKELSATLFSTRYKKMSDANWARNVVSYKLPGSLKLEGDKKALLNIGPLGDFLQENEDKCFLVVEDETLSKFPFVTEFVPYEDDSNKVKILTSDGIYWADPQKFVRMKNGSHQSVLNLKRYFSPLLFKRG